MPRIIELGPPHSAINGGPPFIDGLPWNLALIVRILIRAQNDVRGVDTQIPWHGWHFPGTVSREELSREAKAWLTTDNPCLRRLCTMLGVESKTIAVYYRKLYEMEPEFGFEDAVDVDGRCECGGVMREE